MATVTTNSVVVALQHVGNAFGIALDPSVLEDTAKHVTSVMNDPVNWDGNRPMGDFVRARLFSAWSRVFDSNAAQLRHNFTSAVLGRKDDLSWSRGGGLTVGDAQRLIETLDLVADQKGAF